MGFNDDFRNRTKQFLLRVIKLYRSLPADDLSRIIGKQLIRSSSSVAANFRVATRARSNREFFSKISIVVEEADESAFWIEILSEADIVSETKLRALYNEAIEITKIIAVSRKTMKLKN